jgi:hypothetical protein
MICGNVRRAALLLLCIAVVASVVPGAQTASGKLPTASFTVPGHLAALAASGARVAVAADCAIFVSDFAGGTKPSAIKASPRHPTPCGEEHDAAWVDGLWLGKRTVAATFGFVDGHSQGYSLWTGPVPTGQLSQLGDDWGSTDLSTVGYGCVRAVAAGGGVIATTQVPNRLGDEPVCSRRTSTQVTLKGAVSAQIVVGGSWTLLATDGKRLLLARLDDQGVSTGEVSLVGMDGKSLATPRLNAATVKAATGGWLTPEGLVLRTKGIEGPGWTIARADEATVAEGRVIYLTGTVIRVRRIRGGPDRPLLMLPKKHDALIAAGAFGLAVAIDSARGTNVYRLPWRIIDQTLTAG